MREKQKVEVLLREIRLVSEAYDKNFDLLRLARGSKYDQGYLDVEFKLRIFGRRARSLLYFFGLKRYKVGKAGDKDYYTKRTNAYQKWHEWGKQRRELWAEGILKMEQCQIVQSTQTKS